MEIRTLCQPEVMPSAVKLDFVEWDRASGRMDLDDLRAKLGDDVAAVYWENPGYLGFIETQGEEIVELAHEAGALAIAGVDPVTLGVLTPPGALGADIACGDIQTLGMHMHAGGGCSGLHRLPRRRSRVRPGVPARALHADRVRGAGRVDRRRGDSPNAPRTARATRASTGSAPRPASGRSPPPSTCR